MISVSKSRYKAASCETYYKAYLIDGVKQIERDITKAGTEFHRYKQEYVSHLLEEGIPSDETWAEGYLEASGVSEEARELIARDIPWFSVDIDNLYDVEIFFAVDTDFKPAKARFVGHGRNPESDSTLLAHGTVDHLELSGSVARVIDYKTGWSTVLNEYEAAHYAALVFAHFDEAREVVFQWRFTRRGLSEERIFSRDDFDSLRSQVINANSALNDVHHRLAQGKQPEPNPFSGLCGFCTLECPVRRMATDGEFPVGPIQSKADLIKAQGYIEAADTQIKRAQELVRSYVDARGGVPLDERRIIDIDVQESLEYPLASTLREFDVDCPDEVEFEGATLDLEKATISFGPALKAKKRAAIKEMADRSARVKLRRKVKVIEA